MPVNHEVIYGNLLEKNVPPPDTLKSVVRIQGEFRGQKSAFGISEEVLSKHILLVGGTGSGKTNLFYHIVKQLKSKMTADDVMLIFDSKGDFHKKFYSKGDILIGNSAQYRKQSDKWNIYEEIIADGKDYVSVSQNTQEICKSLFAELVEKNSSNPFFPIAARDLMASIIIALVRNGVVPNNRDIKEYIDSSSADDLRELLGQHRELASVASYIGSKSGSQAQGVLWGIVGVICCCTIIAIPVGIQCFKFASFVFWPFGRDVVFSDSVRSFLLNVIWIIIFGWELSVASCLIGLLWCITIVGIPFGTQFLKFAKIALMPFGTQIVA